MHRRRFTRMLGCVLAAVASIVTGTSRAADPTETWPQWRGPTRDGFVRGATWPTSLADEHLKQVWHVDLGPGYPGPIVAADCVFVAETKDQKREIVRALDRKTAEKVRPVRRLFPSVSSLQARQMLASSS